MKRFCAYNILVVVVFLLLWSLLVVFEVKVGLYAFLKYIFFLSLPLVFFGFFFACHRALRKTSKNATTLALASSLVISPVFIFVGVVLVTNFKLLIGGHL